MYYMFYYPFYYSLSVVVCCCQEFGAQWNVCLYKKEINAWNPWGIDLAVSQNWTAQQQMITLSTSLSLLNGSRCCRILRIVSNISQPKIFLNNAYLNAWVELRKKETIRIGFTFTWYLAFLYMYIGFFETRRKHDHHKKSNERLQWRNSLHFNLERENN